MKNCISPLLEDRKTQQSSKRFSTAFRKTFPWLLIIRTARISSWWKRMTMGSERWSLWPFRLPGFAKRGWAKNWRRRPCPLHPTWLRGSRTHGFLPLIHIANNRCQRARFLADRHNHWQASQTPVSLIRFDPAGVLFHAGEFAVPRRRPAGAVRVFDGILVQRAK
jgi:hypothetical protein